MGADSLSPNLVGFVLAADACPFGAGLPKEVRSDLLADLSGARIFIYRGHCDRVQPVKLPLKFIIGDYSSSAKDAYHISIGDSSSGWPTPRAVGGGITSRYQSVENSSRI